MAMKFFGYEIKKPIKESEEAFSGASHEIPAGGNTPIVNNYSGGRSGLVQLGYSGSDMSLPLVLEQSFYSAPAHKSCIKLKVSSTIGAGYEFLDVSPTTGGQIDLKTFENADILGGLNSFVKNITKDYVIHSRITLKIHRKAGKTIIERVTPSMVGYNTDKSIYYVSRDFVNTRIEGEFKAFNGQREGTYMMSFDGETDKYAPYSVPDWLCAMQYININRQIPSFHEENMLNSINVNLVIRKPTEFESIEARRKYISLLKREQGVKSTGKFMLFSGNGIENVSDVKQLNSNQNDKLFAELRNSSIDDICMGHNVNPILIGVKTAGSLGANQEFDRAYKIFYSIEVEPLRNHIDEVVNYLIKLFGYSFKFQLNDNKAFLEMPQTFVP